MVEEASPLVVGDDEHGRAPIGSVRNGVEGFGEEGIPPADVGMRMIVVPGADKKSAARRCCRSLTGDFRETLSVLGHRARVV